MPDINRIRVLWNGLSGGEGVSTFYALPSASTALADVRDFFFDIRALFPTTLTWTFPGSGDVIDYATGTLTGGWTMAGGAPFVGNAGSATHAAGVGARVRWDTNAIFDGRRLKGSTFLTDMTTSVYEANGTIASGTLTTLQTAADALVATNSISIWHRNTPGEADGGYATVEAAAIPDRVTALRSRRY